MPTLEMNATVTATTTQTIKLKPTVRKKLLASLKIYSELRTQIKALEHALDKHKDIVSQLREETGEQSLSLEGYTVTLVAPLRSKLEPAKLIALGVSMETIQAATTVKPTKAYVKISVPGEQSREEE